MIVREKERAPDLGEKGEITSPWFVDEVWREEYGEVPPCGIVESDSFHIVGEVYFKNPYAMCFEEDAYVVDDGRPNVKVGADGSCELRRSGFAVREGECKRKVRWHLDLMAILEIHSFSKFPSESGDGSLVKVMAGICT